MHWLKKKGPKRCRFERYCGSSSSPRRARQEKKKIFSPTSLLSLSLLNIKKTPTIATCITFDLWPTTGQWKKEETCPSGSRGAAAQWPPQPCLSLVFTYKYMGENRKKERVERPKKRKKKTRRGRKEGRTEKKQKQKQNKKTKRKTGEDRGEETVSCHQHRRRLEPPPPLAITDDRGFSR